MNLSEIKDLMDKLEESKLTKLILKKGDFELHLEKECAPPALRPRMAPAEAEMPLTSDFSLKGERGGATRPSDAPGTYVTSPMVGTYYASPGPDQPSFVKLGDKVSPDTVVCIIEAMKVMNEVKAGVHGTVAEILLDNGQPVEFGTRFLRIV